MHGGGTPLRGPTRSTCHRPEWQTLPSLVHWLKAGGVTDTHQGGRTCVVGPTSAHRGCVQLMPHPRPGLGVTSVSRGTTQVHTAVHTRPTRQVAIQRARVGKVPAKCLGSFRHYLVSRLGKYWSLGECRSIRSAAVVVIVIRTKSARLLRWNDVTAGYA